MSPAPVSHDVNYRHHYHAGNFADVCKHVVLGRLISGLQRKEKGFLYLDSHAGRGRYDLLVADHGDSLARSPEWPEGIGRMLRRNDAPDAVRTYVQAVRDFDRHAGNLGTALRFYPGSPWLAKSWLRPQDRMALCELQPAEHAALAAEFRRMPQVGIQATDGYAAIRALLPCPEKRALVLIDPPFESASEWEDIVDALEAGLVRMPAATFAVWYPLTERARVDDFAAELMRLRLPPTWVADVAVAGESSGLKMRGCGMAVLNPPWQLDQEIAPLVDWLAGALAQAPGQTGALTWLAREI